jgi:hypothetical protein
MLSVEVHRTTSLRFDDGSPVRAASAIAPFGSGWLVAQDDATHAAWWRDGAVTPLRLFPPVAGHDLFAEEDGTKRLKPDLEAACAVDAGGMPGTLLLGWVPAEPDPRRPGQRGSGPATGDDGAVPMGDVRRYDLGAVGGPEAAGGAVPLGISDAVLLDGGRVLVSAAAEDTDDPVADGPVSAAALAVLDGEEVVAWTLLPADVRGAVPKVEGLAILTASADTLELLAVVDADDPALASPVLHLTVSGYA